MTPQSQKTVYVEVVSCGTENEEENDTYAIKIQSSVDSSDMKQVKDQLKTKNKALSDALNAGEISFKREGESVKLKGRWLRLGEDSPLKDEVLIKACLRPRNLMKSFESDATKDQACQPTGSKAECNNLSETNVPKEIVADTQGGKQEDPIKKVLFVEKATLKNGESTSSQILSEELVQLIDQIVDASEAISDYESDLVPPSPKKSKPVSAKKIVTTSKKQIPVDFKVPNRFSESIDLKISRKECLNEAEISKVCREVANAMKYHTYKPLPADLNLVSKKLLDQFPMLVAIKGNYSTALGFYALKIGRIFSRASAESNSDSDNKKKRGRKPKIQVILSPGVKLVVANAAEEELPPVDLKSYAEHVKEMLNMADNDQDESPATISHILKVTVQGRKQSVRHKDFPGVHAFIQKECPFLDQPCHLFKEIDLIFGQGKTNAFRERWLEIAPQIIEYSLQQSNTNNLVNSILKEDNLEGGTSFEHRSRTAIKLLPVILRGQDKSKNAPRHFVDVREDTASFTQSVREIKRTAPFLLLLGESVFLVVDGRKLMELEITSSTDWILAIMACYYVFDLSYSSAVLPTLYFLQAECLALPDDNTDKCVSVSVLSAYLKSHAVEE